MGSSAAHSCRPCIHLPLHDCFAISCVGSCPSLSIPFYFSTIPSHLSILPLYSLSPLLPSFLIPLSSSLLSTHYVACLCPANASALSRSLVPSALSASPIHFLHAPRSASEPSTISSITPLISPPAQRAQALPPSAVIVSPSLPPVSAKAAEKIVKQVCRSERADA